MTLNQQIAQRQEQGMKLSLTPAVLQSLHLLRLSAGELAQYVQEQLLDNPALEFEPPKASPAMKDSDARFPTDRDAPYGSHADDTLEQHLLEQLRLSGTSPAIYRAARYMAGNLDEHGYLPLRLDAIQAALDLPEHAVLEALRALQACDPAGVGARDLQECLLLQLSGLPDVPPGTFQAVSTGLDLIAQGNLKGLANKLGSSIHEAQAIVRYIKNRLNPRPGLAYQPPDRSAYIEPDAYIQTTEDGLSITINRRLLPRLTVNMALEALKSDSGQLGQATSNAYIADRVRSAKALIAGLEQRTATLLQVIQALAEAQRSFIEQGPIALQPLQAKDIAAILNVHPSTVSRAIRHKYARTPRGLFALKTFLSNRLPTGSIENDTPSKSTRHAMERIRGWIATEDNAKPLSDRQLTELLAMEGIRLSRRTVAKYRDTLDIPASPARVKRSIP